MNIDFKLVWFEDEDSTVSAYKDDIEKVIKDLLLIPKITHYRNDTFTQAKADEADLILADFDLQTTTGVKIINEMIRKNNNVVDALLYSSKEKAMVEAIQGVNPLLEGVFCVKRNHDEVITKLEELIQRIVRRSQSLENFRGIVMEYTSIFDHQIENIILQYMQNETLSKDIIDYINNDLNKDQDIRIRKNCIHFEQQCKDEDKCCFTLAKVEAIESLNDYSFYQKSRILNHILKTMIRNGIIDARYNNFHNNFNNDVIIYRNALAHQKSNDRKLYIQAKDSFIDINEAFYKQIRISIIQYKELLDELYKVIIPIAA